MPRASASAVVDLDLIPSRVKPVTSNRYSQLPAGRLASKGQCEEQAGKFTSGAVGKGTWRYSYILVW